LVDRLVELLVGVDDSALPAMVIALAVVMD
jgi:hypothetical protein